ncbi:hypothetical protein [Tunturiibacter lichenicola]|uniref:hypothetical protein n=1 Tax=Tunturiibacter lichenicola TaxID=2051959 RepID=UPI0021B263C9|nr:hypothetical protein [Edaphobacter lichenicola]
MKPRALTLLLLLSTLTASAQRPLIGIFESASSGKGDNQGQPGVRVLFYQSGQQWRSYNAACHDEACLKIITHLFPAVTTWTLVKDNKPIAKVTATIPAAFHVYSEIGVQAITNPGSVANLEPRPNPTQPSPPHTILATTLATLNDPDHWRPSAFFPLDLTHVQQAFRRLYPHPKNCAAIGQAPGYHPWTYTDADIKPDASYISDRNWRLFQVTLGGYLCDGPPDAAFLDQWFAISPTGEVTHIGRLMHFAGAADFAHEGHSELLFEIQGDNTGGYRLFYDNFAHQAHAAVTYH